MNSLCGPASNERRHYYDKGIKVCDEWLRTNNREANKVAYRLFYAILGPKPEGAYLGRINKRKGFEPGNVKWMTRAEVQQGKCAYKKFACARDNELIAEIRNRGYHVTSA